MYYVTPLSSPPTQYIDHLIRLRDVVVVVVVVEAKVVDYWETFILDLDHKHCCVCFQIGSRWRPWSHHG